VTAVAHPTLTDRAREMRALAEYRHRQQIEPDPAYDIASRNWIAASLPNPADAWADFVAAVGLVHDLDAGLVTWADVDPDLTGWDREVVASDLAEQRAAAALFRLLYGPEATPCKRCHRIGRDLISPAVAGGLCGGCADVEWIGGRA